MKKITFVVLLATIIFSCREVRDQPVVGILPYNRFDKALADTVARTINEKLGLRVVVLPAKKIPPSAFVQVKSPRYRADSLLRDLRRIKPGSVDYIIGLTSYDISATKKGRDGEIRKPVSKYSDWGIFGLGYRPGPACVVSTYRLKSNPDLFLSRLKKICVHELGHNFGLEHCETKTCLMQGANETILTIDNSDFSLCEKCSNHLNNKRLNL